MQSSRALMLDEKLRTEVKTERKITHQVILTIREIDITQSYREMGYSSLFNYLVNGVKYSASAAHRRISAARFSKRCPEVETKVQEGKINLSQIALVESAIKQEERKAFVKVSNEQAQEVIKNLEGKNHLETQKILIETFPEFVPPKPQVIPAKNNRIQVNLEFNEADWDKVRSLLAHMSHKVPDQKVESALIYWAEQVEKKKNKVDQTEEKTIPAAASDSNNQSSQPIRRQKRVYISVKIRNQVFQEAGHRCEFISPITGERCSERHFLETDHKIPLALGGSNDRENLRALCRSHNQMMAQQMHLSDEF